jgi:hypothetical protein
MHHVVGKGLLHRMCRIESARREATNVFMPSWRSPEGISFVRAVVTRMSFMQAKVRSVFWENRQVMLIDQRLLPGQFVVAGFDTVEKVAAAIRDMVVRGAPAIGAAGAYGMALAAFASPASDRDSLLADLRDVPKPCSTPRARPPST